MPVSDFECQIARGQIGRYLDGGVLSPQALTGLEEHLAECPGCKAAVSDRRAALLGALSAPTHAVVSMPVENPLVAALRARAEEEPAAPKAAPIEKSAPAKAAPRYAKGAKTAPAKAKEPAGKGAKSNLTKPLALAAVLAVVLVGMGRISHTVTGSSAKASTAFAAESLPETPAKAQPTPAESPAVPAPKAESPVTLPKSTVVEKPVPAKGEAPAPRPTPRDDEWGGLMKSDVPAKVKHAEVAKPVAPKFEAVAAPKLKLLSAKPNVRMSKPKAVRARTRVAVHRAVKSPRRITARRIKPLHRVKTSRRASVTTIRVYGLDGHPLKP